MAVAMRETMSVTELFNDFVAVVFDGNQSRAADALGWTSPLSAGDCQGSRAITPAVALRIEEVSDRRYRKEAFVWPEGD